MKCSYCAEEIQPDARLCPHCRMWVWTGRRVPPFVAVLVIAAAAALAAYALWP